MDTKKNGLILLLVAFLFLASSCATDAQNGVGGPKPVETLALPASSSSVASFTQVQAGQIYTIVVRGVIQYSESPNASADAQSSYDPETKTWKPESWMRIDGLEVSPALSNPEKHEYLFYYVPTGLFRQMRPLTFSMWDDTLPNNRGQFTIELYTGALTNLPASSN